MAEQLLESLHHVLSDERAMCRLDLELELVGFGGLSTWTSTALTPTDLRIGSVSHG